MENKSFFFIPDISGFTHFVKNVEVEHSRHIISELLELIIDNDQMDLDMVEIEGDSVFFFKPNHIPDADEIIAQVKRTYIKFHEHLKLYESRRICECGACSSAASLRLKFVVDVGESETITVKESQKPFGESVIRVHRLLKNNVDSNEYVLYTSDLLDGATSAHLEDGWQNIKASFSSYDELGRIEYKSVDLVFLKSQIQLPPPLKDGSRGIQALTENFNIKASKEKVFEMITNLDDRPKWNTGVDLFKYVKGQVNRVGTKHVCVIGNKTFEFETVRKEVDRGKLVYGERTTEIPVFREATTYFVIDGNGEETNVQVEFHCEPKPIIGHLLKGYFIKKLKEGLFKNMALLKEELEKESKPELKTAV